MVREQGYPPDHVKFQLPRNSLMFPTSYSNAFLLFPCSSQISGHGKFEDPKTPPNATLSQTATLNLRYHLMSIIHMFELVEHWVYLMAAVFILEIMPSLCLCMCVYHMYIVAIHFFKKKTRDPSVKIACTACTAQRGHPRDSQRPWSCWSPHRRCKEQSLRDLLV